MWILGAGLLMLSFLMMLIFGRSYTFKLDVPEGTKAEDVKIEVEELRGTDVAKITDMAVKNGKLHVTFEAENRGKVFFTLTYPNGLCYSDVIYVHHFDIMTINSYMGYTRGSRAVPFSGIVFLLVLLGFNITEFRKGMRESLYQYKNVRNLSWIFFTSSLLLNQLMFLRPNEALVYRLETVMKSAAFTARFAFPFAFVIAILVAISNLRLMKKEGFTWRNMLGVLMSAAILLGTLLPQFIGNFIIAHPDLIDIHNQRSVWPYLEMLTTNLVLIIVSYLEFILIGTIILSVMAAKRVPTFDKDYILILGCQIRKDGTLTKLLQGRADRAIEFAGMQKHIAAKELTFVPSGGQGSDEVMPEAQAIHNYLIEHGIPEERILVEDSSATTQENMRKSHLLIQEKMKEAAANASAASATDKTDSTEETPVIAEPKIAFSTTNYHVFRSGVIAYNEGLNAEGIGSKTRSYFWVNAFIREFIATLHSERKTHNRIVRVLSIMVILGAALIYYANIL